MSKPVVLTRGLKKSFGKKTALDGIDLSVPAGQLFGLVGPDGAGKTTLLRILSGVLTFNSGQVEIMNTPADNYSDEIRNRIGYVSQKFNLYGDLTVDENINFFSTLYPPVDDPAKMKRDLLDFIGLAPFTRRLAANLSGGMKQKLALLCALIHRPKLLLMDEPTTGVDPVSRREFWQIVFNLQGEGMTVLASTPYMDEAEQFDRVALIHKGKFIKEGTTGQIRDSVPGGALEILCPAPVAVRDLLRGAPGVNDVELFGDKVHAFIRDISRDTPLKIGNYLREKGVEPGEINRVPYNMEDIFLIMTGGRENDAKQ